MAITAYSLYSLNEVFDLACWRCGKGSPDMFENEADAELLLQPGQMPWGRAVQLPQVLALQAVTQADLERLKPAHRRCQPRPELAEPRDGEPPYDLLHSVG